jgi:hypothetical protein
MRKAGLAAAMALFLALTASFWNPEQEEWKIAQVTDCSSGSSWLPQVNASGSMIFFLSNCDLADNNRDRNSEIFKWENGNFTQLTDTVGCQFMDLSLSPDGRRLAAVSNCPLGGKNPDLGLEIVYWDGLGGVQVLTQGQGYPSRHPSWSPETACLVFESQADIAGLNQDHSNDVFLADFSASPPELKRISNSVPPGGCDHPQMAGGSVIARCNDDLPGTLKSESSTELVVTLAGRTTGGNPDRNYELISFDLAGKPRQLTSTRYCENGLFAVQPQGRVIVFMSDCDFSEKMTLRRRNELYTLTDEVSRAFPGMEFSAGALAFSRDGRSLILTSAFGDRSINTEHNQEIYISRLDIPPPALGRAKIGFSRPAAVTDFLFGTSGDAAVDKTGGVVVFASNTNYRRGNADGSMEILRAVHEDVVLDTDENEGEAPQVIKGETVETVKGDTTE